MAFNAAFLKRILESKQARQSLDSTNLSQAEK